MSDCHLTSIERGKIQALHESGMTQDSIAKRLGRCKSFVCRELRRNTRLKKAYDASHTHQQYQ